jgi:hypothetical protein
VYAQGFVPGATRQQESGNMSLDNGCKNEMSFSANIKSEDVESIQASLKDTGLSLSDPNVWIGDTGETAHTMGYMENMCNH